MPPSQPINIQFDRESLVVIADSYSLTSAIKVCATVLLTVIKPFGLIQGTTVCNSLSY